MAATLDQLTTRLADAEDAYHKLRIGQNVVVLWDGEFRAEYQKADIDRLQAYIAELQYDIDLLNGVTTCGTLPGGRANLRYSSWKGR